MSKTISNNIDNVMILSGVAIGIDQIETLLGIILLIIQLIWILSKLFIKLSEIIKNKTYDEIDDAFKNTFDELNTLNKNVKDGDNNGSGEIKK